MEEEQRSAPAARTTRSVLSARNRSQGEVGHPTRNRIPPLSFLAFLGSPRRARFRKSPGE